MKRLNLGPKVKFKKAKLPTKKKLFGKYPILELLNVNKHSKELYFQYSKDKKILYGLTCPLVHLKLTLNLNIG